ncbi:MAG: hypothetical protein LBJ63_02560 [Prevotellaceae bacterium]|jgi:hypothetical protein|nr:hypothetical protein [Prevotellaceae bacterium]
MGRKAQSQEIIDAGVMASGIKAHHDVLTLRKIDNAFADDLLTQIDVCIKLNDEQETLKAKLKEKTEEFEAAFANMLKKAGEARKIIKLDMPQSSWREFGIGDKR